MKAAALLFMAAMTGASIRTAYCQDYGDTQWISPWEQPNNNFTNKIAVPTVRFYTNTQAAVVHDQKYRVRQEGVASKGAAALQSGPRIEPRPPTTYLQPDPWVQTDHPWDVSPGLPSINETPPSTNSSVIWSTPPPVQH